MTVQISMIGNLGKDPVRRTVGDSQVTSFPVGVKVGWGDKAITQWFDVSVWGKPADWAMELIKGDRVTVMGELTAREHEGKTYLGVRGSVHSHERRGKSPSAPAHAPAPATARTTAPAAAGGWGGPAYDDDLPY